MTEKNSPSPVAPRFGALNSSPETTSDISRNKSREKGVSLPAEAKQDVVATTKVETARLKNTIKYGPSDAYLIEHAVEVSQVLRGLETVSHIDVTEKSLIAKSLKEPTPANVRKLQELLNSKGFGDIDGQRNIGAIRETGGKFRFDGQIGDKTFKALAEWVKEAPTLQAFAEKIPALPRGEASLGMTLNQADAAGEIAPASTPVSTESSSKIEQIQAGQKYITKNELRVPGKLLPKGAEIEVDGVSAAGVWISFMDSNSEKIVLVDRGIFEAEFMQIETGDSGIDPILGITQIKPLPKTLNPSNQSDK